MPIKTPVKISFIVPCYNSALYLVECMDSIIAFDGDFSTEIICIDDGSTDQTMSILERYRDYHENIFIFRNPGKGPGASRNHGIHMSHGEYVIFVDSDDYLISGLGKELKSIQLERYDFLYFGHQLFKDKTNEILFRYRPGRKINLENFLKGSLPPAVWAKVIKKDLLIENNIFFRENVKVEDIDYVLKLIFHSKGAKRVKGVYYQWRYRKDSESRILSTNYIYDYFACLRIVQNFMKENNLDRVYRKELVLFAYRYLQNIIDKLNYLENAEREMSLKHIANEFNNLDPIMRSVNTLILNDPFLFLALYDEKVDGIIPRKVPCLFFIRGFSFLRTFYLRARSYAKKVLIFFKLINLKN